MNVSTTCLSVKVVDGETFIFSKEGEKLSLKILEEDFKTCRNIVSFVGLRGFILGVFDNRIFVGVDYVLYLVEKGEHRAVLRASKPGNFFWHAVKTPSGFYVQEYGEAPTSIYYPRDLEGFSKLVTNLDIDPHSRHFHYIAWCIWSDALIVTLGDGNVVRVAISIDGRSWKPIYKGPWQFVPVLIEERRWIFGFDSGIARGGIGVYDQGLESFKLVFLSPLRGVPNAQFVNIKRVNDVYVGVLGQPTAIVIPISRNPVFWYLLYISERLQGYNHHVSLEIS